MSARKHTTLITSAFGARVVLLRRSQGLSQGKLGQMIGMDRSYISDIENGKRNLSLECMSKLADGLGVTLSELCEGVTEERDSRSKAGINYHSISL